MSDLFTQVVFACRSSGWELFSCISYLIIIHAHLMECHCSHASLCFDDLCEQSCILCSIAVHLGFVMYANYEYSRFCVHGN